MTVAMKHTQRSSESRRIYKDPNSDWTDEMAQAEQVLTGWVKPTSVRVAAAVDEAACLRKIDTQVSFLFADYSLGIAIALFFKHYQPQAAPRICLCSHL